MTEPGPKFDVREFPAAILGSALPLDVLERRINDWIAANKTHRIGKYGE